MKKKKRLNKNSLIQLVGILLILSSLVYIGYYKLRVTYRKNSIEQSKEEFINENKNNKEIVNEVSKNNKEKILVDNLVGFDNSQKRSKESANKEKLNTVAFLEVDKLGIVLPVFQGTSDRELRDGVGLVEGTDYPSDQLSTVSVLAGHRGGYNGEQTFLNIDKLNNGDEIRVTTKGKELLYRVVEKKIIESTDWSHFTKEDNQSKLILLSCHPYPQNHQRILVISNLVEERQIT
ncbi:MAG: class C sortase [Peptostreptococcus sp.]|uniref:class C sortase n=1 Tax=Peptostreptococcus sp. TaxID=1262 RepID=UPI002FC765AA